MLYIKLIDKNITPSNSSLILLLLDYLSPLPLIPVITADLKTKKSNFTNNIINIKIIENNTNQFLKTCSTLDYLLTAYLILDKNINYLNNLWSI